MRLMFALKFITSDTWGEIVVKHNVLVHHDFEAVIAASKEFSASAEALMRRKFPDDKARANAFYHSNMGGTALDPDFEVVDGYWSYYVEPIVEYSTEDLTMLRTLRTRSMELMAQGWEMVRKARGQSHSKAQTSANDEQAAVPATSLGQALKAALNKKAA